MNNNASFTNTSCILKDILVSNILILQRYDIAAKI